jgi:4-amino-4-deoxy-L-arabinose transferase-like glycosyltransferase
MSRFLIIATFAMLVIGMSVIGLSDGGVTALVVMVFSIGALILFRSFESEEKEFITGIFLGALFIRLTFGIIVHVFQLREFFGGDAITYDLVGTRLADIWWGIPVPADAFTVRANSTSGSGWGMYYFVGAVYFIIGRNILAAQSLCAVVGACTAPMVYFCASKIFGNKGVARLSAMAVAFFPSFVIWSGQLLKDGLIIFLLVLAMTMVIQLQEKFNYSAVAMLVLSMFGIMSLRFYIFYMVLIAVVGSFLIGVSSSMQSVVRRTVVLMLLGVGLTYFGVGKTASLDFERFGSMEQLQNSREDLARSGQSGFAQDADVSTTEGAVSVLPLGFAYLMLAPFPWQVANLRQAITVPEVLLWWAMIPLLVYGLWFTIKTRLRTAFPILLFSLMTTLAYSIFQGNVGTAYRQRTQIQVFLFMFVAVGWKLYQERKEDKRVIAMARQRRLEEALQARMHV